MVRIRVKCQRYIDEITLWSGKYEYMKRGIEGDMNFRTQRIVEQTEFCKNSGHTASKLQRKSPTLYGAAHTQLPLYCTKAILQQICGT